MSSSQLDRWPPSNSTNVRNIDANRFIDPCKYTISKKILGRGTYSRVYECRSKTSGKYYAAKQYSKKLVYGSEAMLQNEFQILKKVSSEHDHILTLVDYFETAEHLYLVTNLALGGELFDKIVDFGPQGKLEEDYAADITKILIGVLNYLHERHIVHCDIKAENILFKSKRAYSSSILLADFGLARSLYPNKKLHEISGTLSYMAPEMFDREKGYGYSVDIWALGVVVYFMLCGYMPFDHDNDKETKEAIAKADYLFDPPEYWDHISDNAKDFISKCFILNPSERPTAEQLQDHPFIKSDATPFKPLLNSSFKEHSNSNVNLANQLREALKVLQTQPQAPVSALNGSISPARNKSIPSVRISHSLSHSNLTSNSISSMGSKLSLLDKPRNSLVIDESTLNGACCESPDTVTAFNTPIQSTTTSRQHSINDLSKMISSSYKSTDFNAHNIASKPTFFI